MATLQTREKELARKKKADLKREARLQRRQRAREMKPSIVRKPGAAESISPLQKQEGAIDPVT